MDHESAFSYKLLFTRVFQLIADIQGSTTQFFYLHNRGFKAIITDMYAKQMSGKSSP
jgi:hypothetical protein